jgi:AraC family transcriptional regulator
METSLQARVDVSETPAVRLVTADDRALAAGPVPWTLQSAVQLLSKAGRALWRNQDEAYQCIVKAAALLLAEAELRETGPETATGADRGRLAPWQTKRVIRFIDDKLGEKIGVQDFAAIARLGRSHFAHAFRATVGEAPHTYLIRRRIERAQQLILFTDKSLAQIALDCGLTDQPHLTRHFRRAVGMSPGAWRRWHRTSARELADSMPDRLPSRDRALSGEQSGFAPRGRHSPSTLEAIGPAGRENDADAATRLHAER